MIEELDGRGFARMDKAKQREIAVRTGQGSESRDLGHIDRSEAGRKGGVAVSQDRAHMAEIGRKGGETVSRNRAHMAEIGRKGGEARGQRRGG